MSAFLETIRTRTGACYYWIATSHCEGIGEIPRDGRTRRAGLLLNKLRHPLAQTDILA